jgi:hypothetical protein
MNRAKADVARDVAEQRINSDFAREVYGYGA